MSISGPEPRKVGIKDWISSLRLMASSGGGSSCVAARGHPLRRSQSLFQRAVVADTWCFALRAIASRYQVDFELLVERKGRSMLFVVNDVPWVCDYA